MLSKRGAIELSMSTIIVVVLGVVLLILGLVFVRGMFGGLMDVSDTTMDKAKSMLGGLENPSKFLTISPNKISIEQGSDDAISVIILNQETTDIPIKAITSQIPVGDKYTQCLFWDTGTQTSESYTIASGKYASIPLLVADKEGPIRATGCKVEIQGAPIGVDSKDTVMVKVEASKALFE